METYKQALFQQHIGTIDFIQDNEVYSTYGVIRGLHFQKGEHAQAKLIRVVHGSIVDIVVDLRPTSATYLACHRVVLSAENRKQLFVPKGFAHGYAALSEKVIVAYKVDAPYVPEAEGGLSPLDPYFAFDWGLPQQQQQINDRDLNWPNHVTE